MHCVRKNSKGCLKRCTSTVVVHYLVTVPCFNILYTDRVIFVGGNCCEKWEEALRIKFNGVNFELSMHSQTLAGKSLATLKPVCIHL